MPSRTGREAAPLTEPASAHWCTNTVGASFCALHAPRRPYRPGRASSTMPEACPPALATGTGAWPLRNGKGRPARGRGILWWRETGPRAYAAGAAPRRSIATPNQAPVREELLHGHFGSHPHPPRGTQVSLYADP